MTPQLQIERAKLPIGDYLWLLYDGNDTDDGGGSRRGGSRPGGDKGLDGDGDEGEEGGKSDEQAWLMWMSRSNAAAREEEGRRRAREAVEAAHRRGGRGRGRSRGGAVGGAGEGEDEEDEGDGGEREARLVGAFVAGAVVERKTVQDLVGRSFVM